MVETREEGVGQFRQGGGRRNEVHGRGFSKGGGPNQSRRGVYELVRGSGLEKDEWKVNDVGSLSGTVKKIQSVGGGRGRETDFLRTIDCELDSFSLRCEEEKKKTRGKVELAR